MQKPAKQIISLFTAAAVGVLGIGNAAADELVKVWEPLPFKLTPIAKDGKWPGVDLEDGFCLQARFSRHRVLEKLSRSSDPDLQKVSQFCEGNNGKEAGKAENGDTLYESRPNFFVRVMLKQNACDYAEQLAELQKRYKVYEDDHLFESCSTSRDWRQFAENEKYAGNEISEAYQAAKQERLHERELKDEQVQNIWRQQINDRYKAMFGTAGVNFDKLKAALE